MKSNKQTLSLSTRKEKVIKAENLCGWHLREISFLVDEIGIDTWLEDRKQSGQESGQVCPLVESYERQREKEQLERNILPSRGAQRVSKNVTETASTIQSSTSKNILEFDDMSHSNLFSILIGPSINQVALEHSIDFTDDTFHENKIPSSKSFVYQHRQATTQVKRSFSPPENFTLANLMRYEKKLEKRRENRLRKTVENLKKIEIAGSVASKTPASIASITFGQDTIQPISDQADDRKCAIIQKSHFDSKLPTLSLKHSSQASSGNHVKKIKEKNDNSCSQSNDSSFDILEKFALLRNAKRKASFADYVQKLRCLQNCPEIKKRFSDSETEQVLKGEMRCSLEFRSVLRQSKSQSLTFDKVRELWHESQRENIANQISKHSRNLASHYDILGNLLILTDGKKAGLSSEPAKDDKSFLSLKGKPRNSKHTCPLQRMLSATNRRIEASQLNVNQEKPMRNKTGTKLIEITRSENSVKCSILGKSSSTDNQPNEL